MPERIPSCAEPGRIQACTEPGRIPDCAPVGDACFGRDGQGRQFAPNQYAVTIAGAVPCECVPTTAGRGVRYEGDINGTFILNRVSGCLWSHQESGRVLTMHYGLGCGDAINIIQYTISLFKRTDPPAGAPMYVLRMLLSAPEAAYPFYYDQAFRGHSQVFSQIISPPGSACSYDPTGPRAIVATISGGVLVAPL